MANTTFCISYIHEFITYNDLQDLYFSTIKSDVEHCLIAGIGHYALENKIYYAPPSTKVSQMLLYFLLFSSCKRCSQYETSANCVYFQHQLYPFKNVECQYFFLKDKQKHFLIIRTCSNEELVPV